MIYCVFLWCCFQWMIVEYSFLVPPSDFRRLKMLSSYNGSTHCTIVVLFYNAADFKVGHTHTKRLSCPILYSKIHPRWCTRSTLSMVSPIGWIWADRASNINGFEFFTADHHCQLLCVWELSNKDVCDQSANLSSPEKQVFSVSEIDLNIE